MRLPYMILAIILTALVGGKTFAQDYSAILLRCIDSSAVIENSTRSQINQAKYCAMTFSDDFYERYQFYSKVTNYISKGKAEDAIFEAVQLPGLEDGDRFLLLARVSVLRIDMNGADDYYSNTMEQEEYSDFNHLEEYSEFCRIVGDYGKAKSLAEKSIDIARKNNDNNDIQRGMLNLSMINYCNADYQTAWQQLSEAETVKVKQSPKWQKPTIMMHKGMIMAGMQHLDTALYFYSKAMEGFEKLKSHTNESELIQMDMARIYVAKDDYDNAISCLKSALSYAEQYRNETDRRIAASTVYLQWGTMLKSTGKYQESRDMFNKSLEQVMMIAQKNKCYQIDLAEVESYQASVEIDMHDYRRAETLCNDALSIYSDPDYEESAHVLLGKAGVLNTYGNLYSATYYYNNAQKKYTEALDTYQYLQRTDGKTYDYERGLVLNNMASMYDNMGRFDDAMSNYKIAAKAFSKAIACNKSVLPTYANTLTCIGNLYRRYNKPDSAMSYLQKAMTLFDGKDDLTDPEKAELSTLCNNLAILYKNTENFDEAEKYYSKSYSLRKYLADKSEIYRPLLADILNNYGLFYIDKNDLDLAIFYLDKALEIRKSQVEQGNTDIGSVLADNYDNLAYAHLRSNHVDEAIENYELSRNIRRAIAYSKPGSYTYDYCTTLYNLATIYKNIQRNVDALNALLELKEAYNDLIDNFSESNYAEIANIDHNIALTYDALNNKSQAYQIMNTVLEEYTALSNMNKDKYLPEVADALNQLGNLASDLGEYSLAEGYYKKSVGISSKLAENNIISYHIPAGTLNNLGLLYYKQTDTKSAEDCFHKARELFQTVPEDTYNIETILSLAMTNINIVQCYIFDKNSGNPTIGYDECASLLSGTKTMLSPYLYNSSANYYYEYAQKLSDNLTK